MDGKTSSAGPEYSNPAALLKLRLQRWVNNNKEKKNLIDMYTRNVKIIQDAFDQIRENTGISSIEEILTTFIKAEEQNHSLRNYVNQMDSEIDMIAEQNQNIESEIKRHEEIGSMNNKQKEDCKGQLTEEISDIREATDEKCLQIAAMEDSMANIKDFCQGLVENFRDSHFGLGVSTPMTYDEDLVFNEGNVTQHLAELEEYFNAMIIYLAHREKKEDAAFSALALENMAEKDFQKGAIQIEAPHTADIQEDETTDGDTLVDPRQMYKKFQDFAAKGYVGKK